MTAQLGEVAVVNRDGTRVFKLRGEFDLSNVWKIEDALLDSIAREGSGLVVVDLSDVAFMDAQLVHALIRSRRAAESLGVGFAIEPPLDPDVWRVARLAAFPLAA